MLRERRTFDNQLFGNMNVDSFSIDEARLTIFEVRGDRLDLVW